jgi:hypothetical protein
VESLEFSLQKQNERYWNSMEFHGISVSLDCIYRLRVPMESMEFHRIPMESLLTNTWSDRSNGIPWNSIGILKSSGFQGDVCGTAKHCRMAG